MKYLVGLSLCVLSIAARTQPADPDSVEEIANSIAEGYIEKLADDDTDYKRLIRDLIVEGRYEVFAALELNRLGQSYISERYIFGSPVLLGEGSDSPLLKELGVDKKSLERELSAAAESLRNEPPFVRIDTAKLKELSVLVQHLGQVIDDEIERR